LNFSISLLCITECITSFYGRQKLDKGYGPYGITFPILVLFNWITVEHHCYLLPFISGYTLRHNGRYVCPLGIHLLPVGVVGRNWSGAPNNPCRVKTIPRPIPEKWYLTPSVISLMGGLLPFGSIFIEMYFVFTSFWIYKANKSDILMNVPFLGSSICFNICLPARYFTFVVK
jgi:hypothetical protein